MKTAILVSLVLGGAALAPGADPAARRFPPRADILALMHRVNDWQKAHPIMGPDNRNWERATWYTGVTAAWKATGDRRFFDQAQAWGQLHRWQVGTERLGANRLFCSQTWLEVYFRRKDRAMLEPTVAWLATAAPNNPAGSRQWHIDQGRSYVDALYGAATLAMLARATKDHRYLETMDTFFADVTGELFDKDDSLYYRDNRYIGKKTARGGKVFWSRGNGWAFAGIAHVLDYLPKNDPRRAPYLDVFRSMAAALVKRQGADGLWRPNLDDPEDVAVPETSGTGFFCFGLAWGIRNRVLDRAQYLPAVERAWRGLAGSVSPDGRVLWGQQVDGAPNPVKRESTHEYVTGTFLLAAGEVYRLAPRR